MEKVKVEYYAESAEHAKYNDGMVRKTIPVGYRQLLSDEEVLRVKKDGYYRFHNTRPNGMNDAYGWSIKAKARVVEVTTTITVTEEYV